MEHTHKIDVPLAHHVEVGAAVKYLLEALDCDDWYVAWHQEHLFVYHLTKGGMDKYAARFEGTAPVEKGIYHGSKAWALSLVPLGHELDLTQERAKELGIELGRLG